jgi:cytochrome c-type biogenesis protein CcmH/NrfF
MRAFTNYIVSDTAGRGQWQCVTAALSASHIRWRVALGDSDEAIKASLRSRYGAGVLMKPSLTLVTVVSWFWLIVVLNGALALAWTFSRKPKITIEPPTAK